MTPPASVEPVRVFRYKHRNVSLRGEDPTPPVTTLFMAYDPLPGTSYSGEDGRWLPVDAYTALMARIELAEAALRYVVAMFTPPHRVVCGDDPRDARHCLEGLEAEIDAVVESARTALRAGGG